MDERYLGSTCIVCGQVLSAHFGRFNQWVGCRKEGQTMLKGKVMFVPVMLLVSPTDTDVREMKLAVPETAAHKDVKGQKDTAADHPTRRGRTAGFFLAGEKEPTKTTRSIQAVYDLIAKHKRGLTMKSIAERLEMPVGTVGWALRKLKMQNALSYKAA